MENFQFFSKKKSLKNTLETTIVKDPKRFEIEEKQARDRKTWRLTKVKKMLIILKEIFFFLANICQFNYLNQYALYLY